MTETISVYFKPLGTVDGVTFYHENLVYTNSAGQTFVTSAYASNANVNTGGASGTLADFTAAATDAATNTPSVWGTLEATTNTGFNPNDTNPNDLNTSIGITRDSSGNLYSSETIATGANLSSQWATINSSEINIANDNLTYSPLTQNSNSTANSALQLAGLEPPTDTGMLSAHWAPAAGSDLTFSCFKDGSGDTVLDLSDSNTTNTMDLVTSPTGNSTNVTVSTGSVVDDAEAATTNTDGSQTDNVTGFNANGSTKFTQDSTIATNGQTTTTITGTGDADYVSAASIALSDNTSATVTGGSNTINAGNSDTLTVGGGTANTTTVTGTSTTATDSGTSDYVGLQGNTDTATLTGASDGSLATGSTDTITLTGTATSAQGVAQGTGDYIALQGTQQLATLSGASEGSLATGSADTITLTGTATSAQGAAQGTGDYIALQGTQQLATLSGASEGSLATGNNDTITLTSSATSAQGAAYGTSDYIALQGNQQLATLTGASDTGGATGTGDTINISGANSVGDANGTSDYVGLNGNTETAALSGASDSVYINGTSDSSAMHGTGDNAYMTDNSTGSSMTGTSLSSGETVNISVTEGSGDSFTFTDSASGSGSGTYHYSGSTQLSGVQSDSLVNDGTYVFSDANLNAGGSQAQWYNPTNSLAVELENFAAANGTGADNTNILDFAAGGSQFQQLTGLGSGTSEFMEGFSGINDTGTEKYTLTDHTSGTSLLDLLAPSTGVISDDQTFTALNATGELSSAIIDNTNNTSVDMSYRYSGNTETGTIDTFYRGSTELGVGVFTPSGHFASGNYEGSGFTEDDGVMGDEDDGGGGYDGGYGGGYELAKGAQTTGTNIGVIAQYDTSSGNSTAANAAEGAQSEILLASQLQAAGLISASSPFYEDAKWNSKVITWSLADSAGTSGSPFSSYMGTQYEALVQQAFQAWGAASGLTFVQTADSSNSDIRLGFGDFGTASSGVVGYTSYQYQNGQLQPNVIIRLEDPSEDALVAGTNGTLAYSGTQASLYQVILHEIGHALGLADNADPNSVMYYQATASNSTLDSNDTAGMQALYGTGPSTLSFGPQLSEAALSSMIQQMTQATATFQSQQAAAATFVPPAVVVPPVPLAVSQHA